LQDTPVTAVNAAPLGDGTATERHVVPFHASAIGVGPALLVKSDPTARQAFGEPQEIVLPRRKAEPLMTAVGVPGSGEVAEDVAKDVAADAGMTLPSRAVSATTPARTILRTIDPSMRVAM
jgi:hypothetical protein